jgi:membrane-associated phospholipid phosphatase
VSVRKRTTRGLLPQGPADLLRQIVLFCGAYGLYRMVRGQVDGRAAAAFTNARHIIDLERHLHAFVEPAVQAWAEGRGWAIDIASWTYLNSHFVVTTTALAFLYVFRNPSYYFVRNMFIVAMGLALVIYVVFPTAPPRLMPEWGFEDSVAQFTGVDPRAAADVLFNPFAAVPSMHVAFALMLAVPMAALARRPIFKAAWAVYPALVAFAVVATGNHWWMDAVLGALTAVVSASAAWSLAQARPRAWAWRTSRPAALSGARAAEA